MHRQLAEYKYVFEKEFGGHTEFFHEIELDELVQRRASDNRFSVANLASAD